MKLRIAQFGGDDKGIAKPYQQFYGVTFDSAAPFFESNAMQPTCF
jgi:hypothetical protein